MTEKHGKKLAPNTCGRSGTVGIMFPRDPCITGTKDFLLGLTLGTHSPAVTALPRVSFSYI